MKTYVVLDLELHEKFEVKAKSDISALRNVFGEEVQTYGVDEPFEVYVYAKEGPRLPWRHYRCTQEGFVKV